MSTTRLLMDRDEIPDESMAEALTDDDVEEIAAPALDDDDELADADDSRQNVKPPPIPSAKARYLLRPISARTSPSRAIAVGERPVLVGREEGDVRLPEDPYLSPRHALFELVDGALTVQDLGSQNGVWLKVRGERLLTPGEQLRVGTQLLLLETFSPAPPAAPFEPGTLRVGAESLHEGLRLLQLDQSGGTLSQFVFGPEGVRLGRHLGDVVFTSDRLMSGTHAVLIPRGDGALLRDLGSRNGCWVRAHGRSTLEPGDAILLGETILRVGELLR